MTATKAFFTFPISRRWRIAALILLTVLLHLLAIHWGRPYFNAVGADHNTVSVSLLPLALPTQAVSLPTASKPKPVKARPKPAAAPARPVAAVATDLAPVLAPDVANALAPEPAAAASPVATDQTAPVADAPSAAAATEPDKTAPANAAGTQYQFDPPPSADLEYEVRAFADNLNWSGTSTLDWKTDGNHYSVDGEVYVRMFAKITFLTFTSSGDIGAFGVAPELYTEKKRNRAATNTHFNRARDLVSFSSSSTQYPRVGGEQDRASIIWQLAAIGRGDPAKFAPGAVIDMFVAGVRDGEVWRMQIVGQEEIRLSDGAHSVWHVVRQPRPGSYDQRLDIWLDSARQWYPARLRFTETNGDYLEMSLSNLKTR